MNYFFIAMILSVLLTQCVVAEDNKGRPDGCVMRLIPEAVRLENGPGLPRMYILKKSSDSDVIGRGKGILTLLIDKAGGATLGTNVLDSQLSDLSIYRAKELFGQTSKIGEIYRFNLVAYDASGTKWQSFEIDCQFKDNLIEKYKVDGPQILRSEWHMVEKRREENTSVLPSPK